MGSGASKNKKNTGGASPEAQQQPPAQAPAQSGPPETQQPSAEAGNEREQPGEGGGVEEGRGAPGVGQVERGRTPEKQAPAERESSPFARKQFFFNKGKERLGPVKWVDLQAKFRTGEFHEKSLVWYKALGGQFVFLKDHPELLTALREAVGEEDGKKGEDDAEKSGKDKTKEEEDRKKEEIRKQREQLLADDDDDEKEERGKREEEKGPEDLFASELKKGEDGGEKGENDDEKGEDGGEKGEDGDERANSAELRTPAPKPESDPEAPSIGAELRRRSRTGSQTGLPETVPSQTGPAVPGSPVGGSPLPSGGSRAQSPRRSSVVGAANRRRSSAHSDGEGEKGALWQRVRAWHRRTSGDVSRSLSADASAPGGAQSGAMGRWLDALDQIQRYTPEEQAARDEEQTKTMEERERMESKIAELEGTIERHQVALERAQQAIDEEQERAQKLQFDVMRLEAKVAEQKRLLEKPRTKEQATQIPATREAERGAAGGGERRRRRRRM